MSNNNENKEPLNKSFREPKLRFPEFNDNYLEYKFGDVFSIFNGLNKEKEAFGFGNPIVNYMDVNKNEFLLSSMIKGQVNTDEQEICRYSITTSDILIARTSETINEIAYSSCLLENISNCTYSGFLLKASPKIKNIVFSPYIVLLLRSPIYRKKLMKLSTETSRALINSDNLAKLIFSIPDLKEQKKTWLLFNQLFKKITITEQKINILKKYKEGLIQQALKSTIKTPLNRLINESIDKTITNNQYVILSSTAKGIFLQSDFFNHQIASKNNTGYKILKEGQIVFSPQNLWLGNINLLEKYKIGCVSPSYKVFDINRKIIDSKYLIEIMKTKIFLHKYKLCSEQGASVVRRNLDLDQFLNIKVPIPSNNKFYNLLNKFSDLIEIESSILSIIISIKNYLLKNMFI